MIEIIYGHEIIGDLLIRRKLSIGHGLPQHGQTSFITIIEEQIERGTGATEWATMLWSCFDRKKKG